MTFDLGANIERASAHPGLSRRARLSPEDMAFVATQRGKRMRWDQIGAQLGVSTHLVRSTCDPSYDPTVLVGERGRREDPPPTDAGPWIARLETARRDPSRRNRLGMAPRVLQALCDRGETDVPALAEACACSHAVLHAMLPHLEAVNIVQRRRFAGLGGRHLWSLAPLAGLTSLGAEPRCDA